MNCSLPLAQSGLEMLPALLAIGVLFYFMLIRPERRRQNEHKKLLEALKKNDHVVTIGGIKGVVVSVRREADEVTVKVDDDTKLRLTIGSIARVETGGEPEGGAKP